MATTNYFEQLAENQQKMMDSWTDYSKKVMDSFQGKDEPAQTSQELFSEWFSKQREVMQKAIQPETPQVAMSSAVDHYKRMMDVQLEYTQKWMEMNQNQMQNMVPGENNDWMQMFTNSNKMLEEWVSQTNQMIRNQMMPSMPFSMMPRMNSIGSAYQDMYKYWDQISKSIQTGMATQNMIKNWLSPDAYQAMLGKLTDFNLSETMKTAAEHATTMFTDYGNWLSEQTSGFTQNFPKSSTMSADANPWMQLMSEMQSRMDKTYAPLTMMNPGKQSQMIELVREAQSEYINFAIKGTEFQVRIFEAGQKALPEAINAMAEQYKKEEKLPEYDAFFNTFVSLLETYLVDMFETEEYASLQNQMAMAGVKVKNRMDKYMELMFEGAPFTRRSETEELVKEVAELKRKLRTVEKSLKAAEATPAPAAPAASTSSSKTKSTRSTRAKKSASATEATTNAQAEAEKTEESK
jgi:hypothetical protein